MTSGTEHGFEVESAETIWKEVADRLELCFRPLHDNVIIVANRSKVYRHVRDREMHDTDIHGTDIYQPVCSEGNRRGIRHQCTRHDTAVIFSNISEHNGAVLTLLTAVTAIPASKTLTALTSVTWLDLSGSQVSILSLIHI